MWAFGLVKEGFKLVYKQIVKEDKNNYSFVVFIVERNCWNDLLHRIVLNIKLTHL